MSVEVTGTPEPAVTWYKDGIPIEQCLKGDHKINSIGLSHTLVIEKGKLITTSIDMKINFMYF